MFYVQTCPKCKQQKAESKFGDHRVCTQCRSLTGASPATITAHINPTSFRVFFDHDSSQGNPLNLVQRSTILALHYEGLNHNLVAQLTGCDESTIRRWVTHYQQHHSVGDEQRSGRPRVTTEYIDTSIVSTATTNPFTTPPTIRRELGISASTRTVRRRLNEAGLFGRVARIEFPFTKEHVTQRLEFATNQEEWNGDKWKRVLFSDETYMCLGVHGQVWVQRPQDAAFLSQFMVQGQTNFAPKIGIWGCFSNQGVGGLRIFDNNMDSRLYTDTLQRFMKPFALACWPNGEWFHIDDNASYHRSRDTQTWLFNNGVNWIKLPPHSPDLNPIENLWADLKRRVESRFPRSISELKQMVTEEWSTTSHSICSNLVASMPDRMQAVLDAGGFKTPY